MEFGKKGNILSHLLRLFTNKQKTHFSPSIMGNGKFTLKLLSFMNSPSLLKKSDIYINPFLYNT